MKKIIATMILSIAAVALADSPFLEGTYAGMGYFQPEKGEKGEYKAELKIEKNHHTSVISVGEQKFTQEWDVKFGENGFFTTVQKQKEIGSGYCGSVWCHTSSKINGAEAEETIAFVDDKIYRLGSFKMGGKTFFFEDVLEPIR